MNLRSTPIQLCITLAKIISNAERLARTHVLNSLSYPLPMPRPLRDLAKVHSRERYIPILSLSSPQARHPMLADQIVFSKRSNSAIINPAGTSIRHETFCLVHSPLCFDPQTKPMLSYALFNAATPIQGSPHRIATRLKALENDQFPCLGC
jgi:hypothetical protein